MVLTRSGFASAYLNFPTCILYVSLRQFMLVVRNQRGKLFLRILVFCVLANIFFYQIEEQMIGSSLKNVVKAFYSSGILFDVLTVFGELSPEVAHHR